MISLTNLLSITPLWLPIPLGVMFAISLYIIAKNQNEAERYL